MGQPLKPVVWSWEGMWWRQKDWKVDERVLDEKLEEEICAKLLSEWLGEGWKGAPGSSSDDDVSMQDFPAPS